MKSNLKSESNLNSYFIANYSTLLKWFTAPFIIILTTIATYWPTINNPFLFDDAHSILKFYNIRNLTLKQLFFGSTRWISFWLNTVFYSLGKFDPFYYRLFNITIHISSGLILFYLLMLLLQKSNSEFVNKNSFAISITSMTLFLLHPVQTQTISYAVQGQLEGLATFFLLFTSLMYVLASESQTKIYKYFFYTTTITSAFFATGTKEIAIVTPAILFLIEWFFISKEKFYNFKFKLPFFIILSSIVFGCYLYLMKPSFFYSIFGLQYKAYNNIGNILTEKASEPISAGHFFISQFKVILHYIGIFLWPFNISVDYDWKLVESFTSLDCWIPFLILMLTITTTLIFWIKQRLNVYVFAFLWFLIAIAPRSSFIPSSELMADYKTYPTSIGIVLILALIFVWSVNKLIEKIQTNSNYTKILSFLFLIIFLSAATYSRNLVWKTGENFWSDIIKKAPNKARGYNNYAIELINKKDYNNAITYLKKAIRLEPYTYPDPYTNLANTYAITNQLDKATVTIKKSLEINPYQPDAYNSLGVFLLEKQDYENAKKALASAIQILPHFGKPYFNLARVQKAQGNIEGAYKAIKYAAEKTDLDNDPIAWEPYYDICMELKKYGEALVAATQLYTMNPSVNNLFKIGVTQFYNTNYEKAAEVFEEILKHDPINNQVYCNIIECYIKIQKPDLAHQKIKEMHSKGITYIGVEVHEAQILSYFGKKQEAKNKLVNFLQQKNLPPAVKEVAKKTIEKLKNFN